MKMINIKLEGVEISDVVMNATVTAVMLIEYENLINTRLSDNEKILKIIKKAKPIKDFQVEKYDDFTKGDLVLISKVYLDELGIKIDANEDPIHTLIVELDKFYDEACNNISESLKPLIERMSAVTKSINYDAVRNAMKVYTNLSKQLTPSYKTMMSSISKVAEIWSNYLTTFEKAKLISSKYNWFIASDLAFDRVTINKLIEIDLMYGDEAKTKIDDELLNVYSKEVLLNICSEIKLHNLLKSKSLIIDEIEIALENNLYHLIITALFPLIEGVIVSGYNHTGRFNGRDFKKYTVDLLKYSVHEQVRELILGSILVQFEHGSEVESELSRNAILHGASNDFGSQVNSTKLILILYELIIAFDIKSNIV